MIPLLRRCLAIAALCLLPFGSNVARAQLSIEILGGAGSQIPIAIVPFEAEATWPLGITGIVGADLARSGLFRLVNTDGVVPRPARALDVQSAVWRGRGADAVVVGSMRPLPGGSVDVRFDLVDVVKQATLASMAYTVTPAQFRATAHKIVDVIYETMTGAPAVFSTRIAYVAKQGSRYQLMVADADGYNPQAIVSSNQPLLSPRWSPDGTRIAYVTKQGPRYQLLVADADGYAPQSVVASNEPLLSPRWSPDGTRLAYVSFENKKPVVYVQSLDTGVRHAVANFRGSNSSPAW